MVVIKFFFKRRDEILSKIYYTLHAQRKRYGVEVGRREIAKYDLLLRDPRIVPVTLTAIGPAQQHSVKSVWI